MKWYRFKVDMTCDDVDLVFYIEVEGEDEKTAEDRATDLAKGTIGLRVKDVEQVPGLGTHKPSVRSAASTG